MFQHLAHPTFVFGFYAFLLSPEGLLLRVLSAYNRTQLTPHVDKADFCVRERNWEEKNSARNTGTNTHTHTFLPSLLRFRNQIKSVTHTLSGGAVALKVCEKKDYVKVKKKHWFKAKMHTLQNIKH